MQTNVFRGPRTALERVFELALIAKALDGVLEIAGSVLLYLVPNDRIGNILRLATQHELIHGRHGHIARYLEGAAGHVTASGQSFAALFLLSHGVVKVVLVVALLRRYLWAYPMGVGAFGVFLLYELYRYLHTHSPVLLGVSVLDLLIFVFICLEWRRLLLGRASPRTNR